MGQPATQASCTAADYAAGICATAANAGDRVDVRASEAYGGVNADSTVGSVHDSTHVPAIIYAPNTGNTCDTPNGLCLAKDVPVEPADAGFPAVTLADLVSFRPTTPQLAGEPAGFGVVRMPTNFVATASAQDIPGVLLGYPVTVRFTPVAYVFSYGDGSTTRSATGGVAWTASGSPQFTPTDTGHVYDARGAYVSRVTVEYSAAVDFGAGWRPVVGVVTARTGDYPIQVVEVRTALVEHTCAEDPQGPGC
jgi:hypothetical protein